MRDELIQRSISVPAEIDELAQRMRQADPDMSYSVAIRKILRAGMSAIASDDVIHNGGSQVDLDALRDPSIAERVR